MQPQLGNERLREGSNSGSPKPKDHRTFRLESALRAALASPSYYLAKNRKVSDLSIKGVKKIFSIPKDITLAYKPRIAFCDSTVVSHTIARTSAQWVGRRSLGQEIRPNSSESEPASRSPIVPWSKDVLLLKNVLNMLFRGDWREGRRCHKDPLYAEGTLRDEWYGDEGSTRSRDHVFGGCPCKLWSGRRQHWIWVLLLAEQRNSKVILQCTRSRRGGDEVWWLRIEIVLPPVHDER